MHGTQKIALSLPNNTLLIIFVIVNLKNSNFYQHQHTHTHIQPFYGSVDFVRDNPGEPVPEETFTHSHLSWSSIVPYLLHPSNMIHGILPVQFTCLTVFFHNLSPSFFGLPLSLAPSTSYSIHFFTQLLSSFRNTCPYHCSLFCYCTEVM